MRALAAAVVIASFMISSIAWGPPLALITKQPRNLPAPINLSIIGPGNETGGMPSSSGVGGGSFWSAGGNLSSHGEPELGQNPALPNPLAGLGEAIENVLNPGVSPQRTGTARSGTALVFAVLAPLIIALTYYTLYARGRGKIRSSKRVRRWRRMPEEVPTAELGEGNVFVRVVRLLSLKVAGAVGKDPDTLTHREVMHFSTEFLGLGEVVKAAVMGYEKLRFASREPGEEEVRAAEEVLRIASRRSVV